MAASAPTHHPPEEMLVLHASGQLDLAARVLVEAHLGPCATCRSQLAELAVPGRHWLEAQPVVLPKPGLLEAIEARLDAEGTTDPLAPLGPVPLPPSARAELESGMPAPRWRSVPLSRAQFSVLHHDPATATTLLTLRLGAGRRLAMHEHEGPEDLVVLEGGFEDAQGHFAVGDWQLNAAGTRHSPLVDDDGICWIIARIERGVRFTGLRGLLQRWAR